MSFHSIAFFLCTLLTICFCLDAKLNTCTWFGGAKGYASDGGACGYGAAVGKSPFSSMIDAGSRSGKGCGACYQVRCVRNKACSRKPVAVVVIDESPGGPCLKELMHFDLNVSAFGAMVVHGRSNKLQQ